jgi:hypothetical protein
MVVEVVGFGVAGGLLKTLDDIHDRVIKPKKKEAVLLLLTGFVLVMAVLILTNIDITIMFIGMMVGVGVAKKIDTLTYVIGLVFLTPFIIYSLLASTIAFTEGGLIIIFSFAAYADELFANKNVIDVPFVRRPLLKLAALAVTFADLYSYTGFFSLLSFDIFYDFVGYFNSSRIVSKDKTLKKLK